MTADRGHIKIKTTKVSHKRGHDKDNDHRVHNRIQRSDPSFKSFQEKDKKKINNIWTEERRKDRSKRTKNYWKEIK